MHIDTSVVEIETPVIEIEETENTSVGKKIVKSLGVSAAATAIAIAGVLAVSYAYGKFQDRKAARIKSEASENEVPENEATENEFPENDND